MNKERQQLNKSLRRSEKRNKDLQMQIEEERAHTESYKQQVSCIMFVSIEQSS